MLGAVLIIAGIVGLGLFLPRKAQAASEFIVNEGKKEAETLEALIRRIATRHGVEEALVLAHVKVESDFNPRAKNPNDPSYGLMAITPILAQDYGFVYDWKNPTPGEIEKLYDPELNLTIGVKFIKRLHAEYPFDAAVQMYNCGETGYNSGVRVPEYLAKVKRYYNEYRA